MLFGPQVGAVAKNEQLVICRIEGNPPWGGSLPVFCLSGRFSFR
jgi:hypothetical protein